MFEYLTPPLVMRRADKKFLEQTNQLIGRRQINYGVKLDLP